MSHLVSEHEENAPSIAFNKYKNPVFSLTPSTTVKLNPSREPPPRDKEGRFIKKTTSYLELSDTTFPSSDSSPLDTPEINQRALEHEHEESEHKVIQQLADDEESLPGAPDPTTSIFHPQSPKHIPVVVLPPVPNKPTKVMTGVPLPALFHGKESENAQNFLQSTEAYFLVNQIADEAVKVALFAALISAGSQADHWWTNLDVQHKAAWRDVKAAFEVKWPAITVAGKTQLKYQKELLALRLKEEDVGERLTLAEITTWSHIHFHNQLTTLVQDAGIANAPVLIHQVRDALPRVLRDLTTPAPADWNMFLSEIAGVNVDILQDKAKREKERKEVERSQNARIARLESQRNDPVEVLRLQMQQATLGANNPMRTMGAMMPQTRVMTGSPTMQQAQVARRQVHYTAAGQTQTGQRAVRSAPTQEKRDLL